MNKRAIIFILLAGIFGSLLFLTFASRNDDISVSEHSPGSSPDRVVTTNLEAEIESSNTEHRISPSGEKMGEKIETKNNPIGLNQLSVVRRVEDAESANDYFNALSELEITNPGLAAAKKKQLDDFCSEEIFQFASESVRKMKQIFCKDYLPPPFDDDLSRRSSVALKQLYDSMEKILTRARESGTESNAFTQLVLNARFPEEIVFLSSEIFQRYYQDHIQIWNLGEEIKHKRYTLGNLINAQRVALLLYQCTKFGGCSKNQYSTIIYCELHLNGDCPPSATLEEMLYQTTPPADFNLANEILSLLLAELSVEAS